MTTSIQTIDINCDMGEAFGNYAMPQDDLLMDHVSSINIACGFHAGDPAVMEETVNRAMKGQVAIGAHPGLPDLQGFGRRRMDVSTREVYQLTLYQIGALYGFVRAAGGKLHHVKPHGALYNMAAKEAQLASAIAQAVYDFDADLYLYGLADSALIHAAQTIGLKTASEAFADRTYQNNGSLTPRTQEGAIISNEELLIAQVLSIVKRKEISTVHHKTLPIQADTICIHGDHPQALAFSAIIKSSLLREGISIKAPQ